MLQHLARFAAMSLFRSLLLVIAGSTQRELARQVRYLKVENEILRSELPARFTVTPKERQRLIKFGSKLGRALHRLVTIVTPGTILRWIRKTNELAGSEPSLRSAASLARRKRFEN
jgi:putative transposase